MMLHGDVTTFASIAGLPAREVERRIGYEAGRLGRGFDVYELRQHVHATDILWGDQTRYSGGWQRLREGGEYARRIDILRAEIGKRLNYNEEAVDAELRAFMGRQVAKLNVRLGPDRIVKILPAIGHNRASPWWVQYPNAPVGGIPQWTILDGHDKLFAKIASVAPGGILAGR
jgi:hypothetical protein